MTNQQERKLVQNAAATAEISVLRVEGGVTEYQVMIHATQPHQTFDAQLSAILDTYYGLIEGELHGASSVFKRYFLSDAANQKDRLLSAMPESPACSCSIVEQPPLNGTKVALWAYLLSEVGMQSFENNMYATCHGAYKHLWRGTALLPDGDSHYQATKLLDELTLQLMTEKGTLLDNCVRTWFFVQNIDANYAGVVTARNEVFAAQGLTPKTHFISSTGINGRGADYRACVQLDSYSVIGLEPGQMNFLYAPDYLNPTYEYGVSFERGTYVDYGDRRQVFISGTASIDNKGNVLHLGDIRNQTLRMWENVEALLAEADCNFDDVGQMIVYLRDVADYPVVSQMFEERFPGVPKVIVYAPVCRPGWLIEMECMATKKIDNAAYKPF